MSRQIFKYLAAAVITVFVSVMGNAQNIEFSVLIERNAIGVAVNNQLRFYDFNGSSWNAVPRYNLTLPDGYKGVFGYRDKISIIANNKVLFYDFKGNSWVSVPVPEPVFDLPAGYKSVFCGWTSFDMIGVAANNKVQFYEFGETSWVIEHRLDFTLPDGYRSVFGDRYLIGVVVNNKVQFYIFNGNSWVVDSRFPDFALPDGYRNVFGANNGQGRWSSIGVIVNNKVQFYGHDGTSWNTKSAMDFTLLNR